VLGVLIALNLPPFLPIPRYDSNGEENADKCAWRFGSAVKKGTRRDGSSYSYNTLIGGQPWMLQNNWDVRIDPQTKKQRGCASSP
jgi:hypothetical protein